MRAGIYHHGFGRGLFLQLNQRVGLMLFFLIPALLELPPEVNFQARLSYPPTGANLLRQAVLLLYCCMYKSSRRQSTAVVLVAVVVRS